ncbi:MAG: C-GCAxxG-C-C family protein [Spirochaetota bacterium]
MFHKNKDIKKNDKTNIKSDASFEKEIPTAVKLSLEYYKGGFFCSEAVLKAFNEVYGLGLPESAYKLATGFGDGMGESGCACGSITGAVAVLGLAAGRTKTDQTEKIVFHAVKQLHDDFRAIHKAICCRVLTKKLTKRNSSQHKKLCELYVYDAARLTDNILRTQLYEYLPQGGGKTIPRRNYLKDFIHWFKNIILHK